MRRFQGTPPVGPEVADFDHADAHGIWHCSMCTSRIGSTPWNDHQTVRQPSPADIGVIGTYVHRKCLERFIARGRVQPRWHWVTDHIDPRYANLVPVPPPPAPAAAPPVPFVPAAASAVVQAFLALPVQVESFVLPGVIFGDASTAEEAEASRAALDTIVNAAREAIDAHQPVNRCNPMQLPLRPRDGMQHMHWSFKRRDHRLISDELLQWLLQQVADDDAEGEPINGGVTQHDIAAALQENKEMRAAVDRVVISRMQEALLPTRGVRIITPKVLLSPPGAGEQAVHFDTWNPTHAYNTISFILHLTEGEGIHSTGVPSYPASELALPDPDENSNAPELRKSAERGLMEPEALCDTEVLIGDNLMFRQTLPHRGTRNASRSVQRAVFFCMVVPPDAGELQATDEYQLFRWQYIELAFGTDSKEHAVALARDADQGPLVPGRIHSAAARRILELVLCKYGQWGAYQRNRGYSDRDVQRAPQRAAWHQEDAVELLDNALRLRDRLAEEDLPAKERASLEKEEAVFEKEQLKREDARNR